MTFHGTGGADEDAPEMQELAYEHIKEIRVTDGLVARSSWVTSMHHHSAACSYAFHPQRSSPTTLTITRPRAPSPGRDGYPTEEMTRICTDSDCPAESQCRDEECALVAVDRDMQTLTFFIEDKSYDKATAMLSKVQALKVRARQNDCHAFQDPSLLEARRAIREVPPCLIPHRLPATSLCGAHRAIMASLGSRPKTDPGTRGH